MKLILITMLGLASVCAQARETNLFARHSVAALAVKKEASSVSLTIRTPKVRDLASGRRVLAWAECKLTARYTFFGTNSEMTVEHRGVFEYLKARFELPADILNGHADLGGIWNTLQVRWYQGARAAAPEATYLKTLKRAGKILKSGRSLGREDSVYYFSSTNLERNRRHSEAAAALIGQERGLDALLAACGTPQGLDYRHVDRGLLDY